MKVAIFGQYYQNDTRPIIKDIFVFFNANNVELVIEENFLKILYEQEIVKKEYKTFNSYKDLNSTFDILDKLEILEIWSFPCGGVFPLFIYKFTLYNNNK